MQTSRKLLVSIHDAAPCHLSRLESAELLLKELGIREVAILLVADFHSQGAASNDKQFVSWCRQERQMNVTWFLHGYSHLEELENRNQGAVKPSDWLKRRFLTGGEGEFLALDRAAAQARIDRAKKVFSHVLPGIEPAGFIAPAWLFNRELFSVLSEEQLDVTEDHHHLYHVTLRRTIDCPVISWATRTLMRRYGSRFVNPLLLRYWQGKQCLRIALHPMDFEYPETIASIRRVLLSAVQDRDVESYSAFVEDGNGSWPPGL